MPMPSLRHIARLAFGSLLSERVELFADPSEVSVEEKSVRPFSRPKDAPSLFWARLMVDYSGVGSVKIFPTSTLKAEASYMAKRLFSIESDKNRKRRQPNRRRVSNSGAA